ncbi:MAG: hypothetical protein HKN36_11740 [Hellea sp.]|nr:hypothetical protein [Hellea sp.]
MFKVRHILTSAAFLVTAGLLGCGADHQNKIDNVERVVPDVATVKQDRLKEGTQFLLEVEDGADVVDDVIDVLSNRFEGLGLGRFEMKVLDVNKIELKMSPDADILRFKRMINETADLSFHLVHPASDDPVIINLAANEGQLPPVSFYFRSVEGGGLIVHPPSRITGDCIEKSEAIPHPVHGRRNVINFSFNAKCAQAFAEMTSANIGKRFAVVMNEEIITAPVIRSPIDGGQGFIEGSFTKPEADELAVLLNSGRLPARVILVEEKTFSE